MEATGSAVLSFLVTFDQLISVLLGGVLMFLSTRWMHQKQWQEKQAEWKREDRFRHIKTTRLLYAKFLTLTPSTSSLADDDKMDELIHTFRETQLVASLPVLKAADHFIESIIEFRNKFHEESESDKTIDREEYNKAVNKVYEARVAFTNSARTELGVKPDFPNLEEEADLER